MLETALPVFSREKLPEICNSQQIGKSLKFELYGLAESMGWHCMGWHCMGWQKVALRLQASYCKSEKHKSLDNITSEKMIEQDMTNFYIPLLGLSFGTTSGK